MRSALFRFLPAVTNSIKKLIPCFWNIFKENTEDSLGPSHSHTWTAIASRELWTSIRARFMDPRSISNGWSSSSSSTFVGFKSLVEERWKTLGFVWFQADKSSSLVLNPLASPFDITLPWMLIANLQVLIPQNWSPATHLLHLPALH